MAETLIIILAEHNVPINFANHFTKLVSNKLVFPDSVFLRMRAARAPCSLKVVIARVVTNFFFQKLNRSDLVFETKLSVFTGQSCHSSSRVKQVHAQIIFCLFVLLFNVPVNNYGHVDTISKPYFTFPEQA